MKIDVEILNICKLLAETHNKRSWVPLFKTWIGINMLAEQEFYTSKDLEALTGLSAYQIRESTNILRKANVFSFSRAYLHYQKCLGTTAMPNIKAFYECE